MTWPFDPSLPRPVEVPAGFFDGKLSVRHRVLVSVRGGELAIAGEGVARSARLEAVEIAGALGGAPPMVRFADGAYCEIEAPEAFAAMLAAHGVRPSRVMQWEGSLRWVVASAVLFVVLLVAAYRYLVPALAVVAADQVPDVLVDGLSRQVLDALDGSFLQPSALRSEVRARIVARFGRLRLPGQTRPDDYTIVFRKSTILGPNALALPSGALIVTDALVDLAHHDDEVVAVLAHEIGHVVHRHGLRQVLQESAVGLAVTWFLGDVSFIVAAAPSTLLKAKYSRDLEREADAHAVEVLTLNHIPLDRFAAMLRRLEEAESREAADHGGFGGTDLGGFGGYLSSHPVTSERIARLSQR